MSFSPKEKLRPGDKVIVACMRGKRSRNHAEFLEFRKNVGQIFTVREVKTGHISGELICSFRSFSEHSRHTLSNWAYRDEVAKVGS